MLELWKGIQMWCIVSLLSMCATVVLFTLYTVIAFIVAAVKDSLDTHNKKK